MSLKNLMKITFKCATTKIAIYTTAPDHFSWLICFHKDLPKDRGFGECIVRYFWIDEDGDEIDLIDQVGYVYFKKIHEGKKMHIYVSPIVPTENVSVTGNAGAVGNDASGFDVHDNVACDACNAAPIVGFRYKCVECPNYDLCQNCEAKHKHPEHMVLRMPHVNCPNIVKAFVKTGLSGSHHRRSMRRGVAKTQCPFSQMTFFADANGSAAGATEETESTQRKHYNGHRHGRRHMGRTILSNIYDIMYDLAAPAGGGAASAAAGAAAGAGGMTSTANADSSQATEPTKPPTTAPAADAADAAATAATAAAAATETKQDGEQPKPTPLEVTNQNLVNSVCAMEKPTAKLIAAAAALAKQLASETVAGLTTVSPTTTMISSSDETTAMGSTSTPTKAPATDANANAQGEAQGQAQAAGSSQQPSFVNAGQQTALPNFDELVKSVPPECMRAGIEILNDFGTMFAKMMDPQENNVNVSDKDKRKNSTTSTASSQTSDISSTMNSINSETQQQQQQPQQQVPPAVTEPISNNRIEVLPNSTSNIAPQNTSFNIENDIADDWQMIDKQTNTPSNNSSFADLNVSKTDNSNACAAVEEPKAPNHNAKDGEGAINYLTSVPEHKRAIPVYHLEKKINDAVYAMMAMGFSNEGGWLTQLLESVNGNIEEALDLMTQSQRYNK